MLVSAAVFVFGLAIGSFLNVCIWRMPREESVVRPPSHCPACGKTIPWFDNAPLVSFVVLRGRCRFCGVKISPRYFLVELLTAVMFVVLLKTYGLSIPFLIWAFFISCLIIATFVDISHFIIPDEISVGGMFSGALVSLLYPSLHHQHHFLRGGLYSIAGALVGGGLIYVTGLLGDRVFKKESMGGGDVKLLAMIGSFLGWKGAVITYFLAPFFGSLVSISINIYKFLHEYYTSHTVMGPKEICQRLFTGTIPYGPFLSLAALITLFFEKDIILFLYVFLGIRM